MSFVRANYRSIKEKFDLFWRSWLLTEQYLSWFSNFLIILTAAFNKARVNLFCTASKQNYWLDFMFCIIFEEWLVVIKFLINIDFDYSAGIHVIFLKFFKGVNDALNPFQWLPFFCLFNLLLEVSVFELLVKHFFRHVDNSSQTRTIDFVDAVIDKFVELWSNKVSEEIWSWIKAFYSLKPWLRCIL